MIELLDGSIAVGAIERYCQCNKTVEMYRKNRKNRSNVPNISKEASEIFRSHSVMIFNVQITYEAKPFTYKP